MERQASQMPAAEHGGGWEGDRMGEPPGQRLDSHEADLEHGSWLLIMLKTLWKSPPLKSTSGQVLNDITLTRHGGMPL